MNWVKRGVAASPAADLLVTGRDTKFPGHLHTAEHRLFCKQDQTLEHFCLAGKMPVERRFRNPGRSGQGRGGDPLTRALLQLCSQCFQDQLLAWAQSCSPPMLHMFLMFEAWCLRGKVNP